MARGDGLKRLGARIAGSKAGKKVAETAGKVAKSKFGQGVGNAKKAVAKKASDTASSARSTVKKASYRDVQKGSKLYKERGAARLKIAGAAAGGTALAGAGVAVARRKKRAKNAK